MEPPLLPYQLRSTGLFGRSAKLGIASCLAAPFTAQTLRARSYCRVSPDFRFGHRRAPDLAIAGGIDSKLSQTTPNGGWYFTRDCTHPLPEWHFAGMETFRWLPLRRGKRPDASLGGHCVAVESDDPDTALFDKQSVRSRESGNFPVCRFRMIPDPVTFMALLVSMARAIQHMPALKTIELEWEMENGLCWGVNYYAAGFLPSSCSVNEEAAWADFNYCRDEKCVYHEDKHRPNSVLEFHYIHRTRPRWLCSQGGRYKIAISALGLPEFVLPPGLVKMLRALSKGGTFYIRDSRRRRWQ